MKKRKKGPDKIMIDADDLLEINWTSMIIKFNIPTLYEAEVGITH